MYSSGYAQVNKFGPEAQKKMQYRSKGKSCGYYMRIVFFFSSLIQSLIIVSLVLFLVYGKTQDTATRIQDMEESFSRLSIENVALRQQRKNLTNLLNITLTNKAITEWDLRKLRHFSNMSIIMIQDLEKKHQFCQTELTSFRLRCSPRTLGLVPPLPPGNCGLLIEQMKARLDLVESNFTQTTQRMKMEREEIVKEKENLALDCIHLRRDKSTLGKEIELLRQMSKAEFSQFLGSVSTVTKALLEKIESLFPRHIAFQLTCPKQREHLEQIHTNCTSLSREVEDRLQRYLNSVGEQVSNMQVEHSRLNAENWRLSEDYRWCSQNRTGMIEQHKRSREELQQKHDRDKEKLLIDKMKLIGDIDVLRNNVKYKSTEVDHLKEQLKQLNMTCMMKTGPVVQLGGLGPRPSIPNQGGWSALGGGGSSSSSSTSLGVSSTGLGGTGSSFSSGSAFNKPASPGLGSSGPLLQSLGSSLGLSNSGAGFNKPGSAGGGLSSSPFTSSGSSSGLSNSGSGVNKLGSSGGGLSSPSFVSPGSSSSLGNSGSGFSKPVSAGGAFSSSSGSSLGSSGINKPAESGRSSTSTGSTGSSLNVGSSDVASNKPTSSVKSTSGFGFGSAGSSGSSGSSKSSGSSASANSPFSWLGLGSSTSGQSKTGSVPGKTSTGTGGTGGTGSLFGGGRTSGSAGGPGSVSQHIQELQRLINPPDPPEKQDLSRMLG